ncbi:hypothetical protein GQ457_14G012990 [Hibiscus cannabinus]
MPISSSPEITSITAFSSGSPDILDSSSLAITCNRLTGNNYLEWSQSIKIYIVDRGDLAISQEILKSLKIRQPTLPAMKSGCRKIFK